jgi:ubiquinol-cytochrome c reductase cytochrome c1 subunit
MKKTLKALLLSVAFAIPMGSAMASGGAQYEKVEINLGDQKSLQRGAQIFTNYCLSCHSANSMRFNRLQDLGLTEQQIKDNMMFTTDKIGETMHAAMSPADATKWFGAAPPDLSLIARSRGADYLYAYMRGFYKDPTRPTGWNNKVFDKVGMPHVLWEQQGIQAVDLDAKGQPVMEKDEHGNLVPKLHWERTGLQTRMVKGADGKEKVLTAEYDEYAKDLVNYLVYMGEPSQPKRHQIGYIVLMFLLVVLLPCAYFLNKEYWKDVH